MKTPTWKEINAWSRILQDAQIEKIKLQVFRVGQQSALPANLVDTLAQMPRLLSAYAELRHVMDGLEK